MFKDKTIYKYYPILVMLMLCIPIVNGIGLPGKSAILYAYAIYSFMGIFSLFFFWRHRKSIWNNYKVLGYFYSFVIIYICISWIKSFFVPSGLFPFFRFQISMALLNFGSVFIFMNGKTRNETLSKYWKWLPYIFVGSIMFAERQGYMSTFSPILFYLCFWTYLSKRRKIICIILYVFMRVMAMQQRMDYIDMAIPLIMILIYKLIKNNRTKFIKNIFYTMMFLPFFFLFLAKFSSFNILDFESYIEEDVTSESAGRFNDDTRTLLYKEAYSSAKDNNYVLLGRTPFYGYDSKFIEVNDGIEGVGGALNVEGQRMQRCAEVAVINIFTWMGVIGVLFFFYWFYNIGKKSLNSNNSITKMLGIYVSIYWVLCWIGHIIFVPSMDYIVLFIVISMISSKTISKIDDKEADAYFHKLLTSNQSL